MRLTLAKIGLPFDKAIPLVHFPKALKRPRNNAGLTIVKVQRPSEQPGLGPPPKKCELQLLFAAIRQVIQRSKAIHHGHVNMQFQQNWPKVKKSQLF